MKIIYLHGADPIRSLRYPLSRTMEGLAKNVDENLSSIGLAIPYEIPDLYPYVGGWLEEHGQKEWIEAIAGKIHGRYIAVCHSISGRALIEACFVYPELMKNMAGTVLIASPIEDIAKYSHSPLWLMLLSFIANGLNFTYYIGFTNAREKAEEIARRKKVLTIASPWSPENVLLYKGMHDGRVPFDATQIPGAQSIIVYSHHNNILASNIGNEIADFIARNP